MQGPIRASEHIEVLEHVETSTYIRLDIDADVADEMVLLKTYFPGWKYYIDGKKVATESRAGFTEISVDPGKHMIEARFTNSWVRTLSNVVSAFSMALLLIVL